MYRKPFRTPFVKANKRDFDEENPGAGSDASGTEFPPKKKFKQGQDGKECEKAIKGVIRTTPVSQSTMRPLLSLKSSAVKNAGQKVSKKVEESDSGTELYFNVLWRKYTTKKHKTFDGDGVLIIVKGYVTLQDLGGKDLGKTMWSKPLQPGDQLSVGGKEVEIDSVLSRADYLAGRPFLKSSTTASVANLTNSNSESLPPVPKKQFKPPLFISGPSVPQKFKSSKNHTPRHDPDAPNALVMTRSPSSSIPSGKRFVDVVVDPFISQHLRHHQREGVRFLYEAVMGLKAQGCQGAILADEMGLGKTLQTIALLWTLMKQNPIYDPGSIKAVGGRPVVKKALIVCPVTLINNWRKEFRKWLGNERIGVLVAGEKTNLKDFTAGKVYNVMIVGYERLQKIQSELKKAEIDIVIADEGHRLKSEKNKAAQAIRNLKTRRRVILSGTPLQNDLHEFFIMVDFVNPGLLDTYATFRRTFEAPIVKSQQPEATSKDIEMGKARADELASITKLFVLRRTAEILSKYLPPKTEYVIFCRPTTLQLDVYKGILDAPAFNTCLGNPQSSLQLITLLKKICNSPSLIGKKSKDEGDSKINTDFESLFPLIKSSKLKNLTFSRSGKLRVLERMLVTLRRTTDEKIVLVSNYTSTLDLLQSMLSGKGYSFLRLDGSTPAAKRQDVVDKFNRVDSEAAFAFLLSAKSGGAGINLIGASRLVLFDLDWNPATDHQAMARIHRDGQLREVKIYRMITTGCIDEKIYQRQLSKQGLANSIMDQRLSASSFSLAELRDLFTLDEGTDCQTHDLLDCECGGRGGTGGLKVGGGSEAPDRPEDTEEEKAKVEDASESETDSLPVDLLPRLMKASQVDMSKVEEEFQKSRPSMQRIKKEQLSVLMGFDHIAVSALLRTGNNALASKNMDKVSVRYEFDAESKEDNDVEETKISDLGVENGSGEENADEGDDPFLADEVLASVIKQGDRMVSYVFQKFA
ncbi:SNF2 family N-terminal domain-containing protein [Tirmania nivea]|nr:SNF2 family N-terminal domain-containing protein [Tirmania nivea]